MGIVEALLVALAELFGYLFQKTPKFAFRNSKITTEKEGLVGSTAIVEGKFEITDSGVWRGLVFVNGDLWRAAYHGDANPPALGESVNIEGIDDLTLKVLRRDSS